MPEKNKAAVELAGLRMVKMTPEERRAVASMGGKARAANLTAEEVSAIGRTGGKKGGKARAATLSPERRSEIARKGSQARWRKYREAQAAEERGR